MYMYVYIYIYIYVYTYTHVYIYIYICIYICNLHLGLINTPPPLILFFLQTTSFTIDLLSNRPEIYKIMAKTLLIIFPPSWGDPFARIKHGTFIQ